MSTPGLAGPKLFVCTACRVSVMQRSRPACFICGDPMNQASVRKVCICGRSFTPSPRRPGQVSCSKRCSYERLRDFSLVGKRRACAPCGSEIVITERMVRDRKYLCDACWKKRRAKNRRPYGHRYKGAHQVVHKAIKAGDLVPLPCKVCGLEKSEAHHDDYSKPLEVVWLCKRHHVEADEARRLREA